MDKTKTFDLNQLLAEAGQTFTPFDALPLTVGALSTVEDDEILGQIWQTLTNLLVSDFGFPVDASEFTEEQAELVGFLRAVVEDKDDATRRMVAIIAVAKLKPHCTFTP